MPNFFFVNGGQSIQSVINGASVGDTIMVGTGTYAENLTINKSLNIISLDGAGTTTIDGTVAITAGGVDFGDTNHGFTVQPGTGDTAAISLGAVSNVHIEGNTLVGNATAAANLTTADLFAAGGDSNISIENNVFSGTADTLLRVNGEVAGVADSHTIALTDNTFSGTVTAGGARVVLDADTSSLSGNTFSGGGSSALVLEQDGNTVASSNTFTGFTGTTDIVTVGSFDLSGVPTAKNLTLADYASDTQTFDNMALGPITDGENGWKFVGSGKDQQIVNIGGNHEFRMSSDPSVADFSGPFSPQLAVAAGEAATGALAQSQSISFDFKAVHSTPDGSRLEIDFGNAAGTDRNNFLVIESFAGSGIRIAVSEPDPAGDFSGDNSSPPPNDYRELASNVDPTQTHHLEMRLTYVDGADNDVIQVYLDGQYIGETTTFENYHDALGGTHLANAEANLTDRVFFRGSANGAPQDGPGGAKDAGFNIDNVSTATYNNTNGTGNALDNVITGNDGDNTLSGLAGADTLNGGGGNDLLIGGAGNDALDGGAGLDTASYAGTRANYNVTFDGTTATVVDTRSLSPDGTDTVTNAGVLQFTDHKVLLVGAGSDYKTIQSAVNAAHDGDTILVGPGHYKEQVTVDGLSLTIIGAGQDQTFIDSPDNTKLVANVEDSASSRPDKYALVGVIHDANLKISGLTIDGHDNGTIPQDADQLYDFVGIEGVNATINANHVTVTGIRQLDGIYPSGVQHNSAVIVDNTDSNDRGFTMSNSIVENFQKNGMVLAGEGLTVDVNHNTVTGAGAIPSTAQNGIELFGGATGSITDNTVSGIDYSPATVVATGILVFDAPGVIVSGNQVTGAAGDGDAGIYIVDSDAAVANNNTLTNLAYGLVDEGAFTTPLSHSGNVFNPADANGINVGFYPDSASTTPYTFSGGAKADDLEGAAGADHLNGLAGNDYLEGNGGDDALAGGAGNDTLVGDAGTDTATYTGTLTAASFSFDTTNHVWVVNAGAAEGTDTLTGVEVVTDGAGHTFRLVDAAGTAGYTHIQDAVDAASANDFILIAPGTYSESKVPSPASGTPGGLYVDKAGLTLRGYSSTDGSLITTAAEAKTHGPTVISAHQTDFGSNIFVGPDGTGVTLEGLHLQAGDETDNKLLEIWGDNVTVANDFIDVNDHGTDYTGAVAIYLNGNGVLPGTIQSYTIDHNILNEGIDASNGIGNPPGVAANELITNNVFEGTFDDNTGLGRYETLILNGKVPGLNWLLAPVAVPTVTGNTFANNTTPFLARGSDQNAANLPTAAEIAAFVAANGDSNTTYAYVLDGSGNLRLADRDDGAGPYHSFAVTKTLDVLNLALDATPDSVFGSQRIYEKAGDTVVIQSGDAGTINSSVMVENLTIKATQHSADLNLTLATQLADGTAIAGGGVAKVTLADYASGLGANVDVTGNALANTITGNDGNNTLRGMAGNDTLKGGGGNDFLDGGADTDTVVYAGARANYQVDDIGGGQIRVIDLRSASPDGTDTVQNVESFQFSDGTFTAATVLNDPPTGGVTITGAATENVTLSANTATLGDADGLGALHYQWQRDSGAGFSNVGSDQSTYHLGNADDGTHIRVVVSYTDGHGTAESVTSASTGAVANVDDAPVAVDSQVTGDRNAAIPGTVSATDVDNTPAQLSYSLSGSNGGATHGTVAMSANGHFTYTPAVNFSGLDSFHFVASDGTLTSNVGTESVVVTSTGVLLGPSAHDDTNTVSENQNVTGNVITGVPGGGADTDTSALTVTHISGGSVDSAVTGSLGTLVIHSDGSYSYTADHADSLYAGSSGTDQFTYTVTDASSVDATAHLTITVNGVNTGTSGNDHIVGGPTGEALDGGDGNDVISGNGGDDTITGGNGDDQIGGGDGNDLIGGNAGNDTITGDAGNDLIGGDDGNDNINGGDGNDTLFGGAGDDVLHGGANDDIIVGMDGNDMIFGDDGNDIANGGAGADTMDGGAGNDILGGGADNDTLTGGDGDDQLWGEDGNDTMNGGVGNDSVAGGAGNDQLGGGAGDDVVVGDDGNDVMFGEAGNDRMNGGTGNDVIFGGDGDDQLGGGTGDDVINGGTGNDTMWGEAGADTFSFTANDGNDLVVDFAPGTDHIALNSTILHSFTDVQSHATTAANGSTVISYNGGSITLNGVGLSSLHASDFMFG